MEKKPLVSIIIPTLNREKVLCDTIDSVLADSYEPKEIIVVDQSDKHERDTIHYFKHQPHNVHYYQIKDWKSAPGARNYAIKRAKGELIVCVDDDVLLEKNFLSDYVDAYLKNPDAGIFCGLSKVSDNETTVGGHITRSGRVIVIDRDSPLSLLTPLGANVAFRTDALKKVKGYDAHFLGNAMREESDLALRILKAGYKIMVVPKAKLTHLATPSGGTRAGGKSAHWYYTLFHNETLFFLRHYSILWLPFFAFRMTRPFLASWLYYGRGRINYFFAPFRGFVDGYKNRKTVLFSPKES